MPKSMCRKKRRNYMTQRSTVGFPSQNTRPKTRRLFWLFFFTVNLKNVSLTLRIMFQLIRYLKKWIVIDPSVARPWECYQSRGQNNSFRFYLHENISQFLEEKICFVLSSRLAGLRIDLNSQKIKFPLFCPPDWLHSHDVQGAYKVHYRW